MKFIPLMLIAAFLCSCGGQDEPAAAAVAEPEQAASETAGLDDAAAEYQAKVQTKTRNSVVNSLVREWGVPEENVRCVLDQLKISQIQKANTDPAAQAVFKECGVDPAVVN